MSSRLHPSAQGGRRRRLTEELDRSKLLQAEWQKRFLTEEFVSRAHDDAETIWKTFLQASGLSVFDTITQGDRNIQFISYVD
jgi:hypothetical protein